MKAQIIDAMNKSGLLNRARELQEKLQKVINSLISTKEKIQQKDSH